MNTEGILHKVPRPVVIGLGLCMLLSGCAGASNTPAQDLAYNRWGQCNARAPDARLREVEGDGRIWFRYVSAGDRAVMLECLAEVAQGGPALPEPRALERPRGP